MDILLLILIYAGIVQGFYMAFLLNHNKRRNGANKYLALLMVTMSVSILHSVFVVPEIQPSLHDPFKIREPFLMLVIPLIWLYVKKLEQPLFRFSLRTTLHFLPFVVFMAVNIQAMVYDPVQFLTESSTLLNGAIWAVLLIQYSFYLIQIVKITQRFKQRAEQELSNIELVELSWLNAFLYAFIIVFTLLAILFAGAIHHFGTQWMNRLVSLSFSMAIFILGYKGLFQQSIFSNAEAGTISEPISLEVNKPKAIDEILSVNLRKYMETFQPHRDPELTLTLLAKMVNLSRNQLSEVTNSSLGCNFYDFVNKYRVEDVKQLMVNSRFKDYTLLAIAFEAGFPSKSTFNSIFKKFTGLTPSEYRNGLS